MFKIATFRNLGIRILGEHFITWPGEERKDDGDRLLRKDLWKNEHQHGVVLHGVDLENLCDQWVNGEVCVDLVAPFNLTCEVKVNWADEVFANQTDLFELLFLLCILIKDLVSKSILITFD